MAHPRRATSRTAVLVAAATALITIGPLAAVPAAAHRRATAQAAVTAAAPTTSGAQVPLDIPPGRYQITLITGDRVELTVDPGGRYQTSVDADAGFQSEAGPDGLFVYPEQALAAIRGGQLDRDLFNLAYLAANGYADAATGSLPVIVTFPEPTGRERAPDARTLARRVDALPATTAPVGLASVDGAGVAIDKHTARQFWQALAGAPAGRPSTLGTRSLALGVRKVWLDRRVTASLDVSVPLIGAPEAWDAGFDGTGVRVAVLDTGADATHPDLAGKIVTSKSFVPGVDSTADGNGHGTHVAATVAGTGAASDGLRKGVAPGAQLVIGKVLNDDGNGDASMIISGMEWAAGEQDADIVSMSLGTNGPTDGGDILSQAVNELTDSTGALFVVAAGNSGPRPETISAPGAADAALTVAATDKADATADFSSRGPRRGNLALKPDIAAPGVAIVAARAAGTSLGTPVDDLYTSLSGTSMATPHVAGAAAILAQRHPDWSAAQLKATLMSTSKDVGRTVYDRGAGRLDVARAVRQQVAATTAAVDYGPVEFADGAPLRTRQIGYRNDSDRPVTLTLAPTLASDGKPAPGGALTADPTVTVPPGGTATATVALDTSGVATARYSGAVVATDEGTGTRITTPVAAIVEPRKVTLTIRTLDRAGLPIDDRKVEAGGRVTGYAPFASNVMAVDVPGVDSVASDLVPSGPGVERVRVAPGTYSIRRQVFWWDDVEEENYVQGLLFQPQVAVTADTEVVLDARKAKKLEFVTSDPTIGSRSAVNLRIERSRWDGNLLISTSYAHYVTPTGRVTAGTFRVAFNWDRANPQLTASVRRPYRIDLHPASNEYADQGIALGTAGDGSVGRKGGWVPFPAGDHRLDLVDAGFGDPADIAGRDLHGKLALVQWGDDRNKGDNGLPETVVWTDRIANVRRAGAVGVVLFPNPPVARNSALTAPAPFTAHWAAAGEQEFGIPDIQVKRSEGLRLLDLVKSGRVSIDVRSDPNVRTLYHLDPTVDQQVPENLRFTFDHRNLARIDSSTHYAGPLSRTRYATSAWKPGTFFNTSITQKFAIPKPALTEYYGPTAGDVLFRSRYLMNLAVQMEPQVFARPEHRTEQRNAAPRTPGAVHIELDNEKYRPPPGAPTAKHEYCAMCRQGNRFLPSEQLTAGGGDYFGSTMDLASRLFAADGTEIPRTTSGFPAFVLPPQRARYRLVQDASGVGTTWTFTSAAPQRDTIDPNLVCWGTTIGWTEPCAPQPLIFLRYDLGRQLRLDDTAPAGRPHLFEVVAYHGTQSTQPAPDIAGLRLWSSTDGGEHWQPVLVFAGRGDDGTRSYRALTIHPNKPGATVSLKAEAWDRAGNRIQQTVTSAFTLAGRDG